MTTTTLAKKPRKPRQTKFSEAKDQTRTIFITPTAKAQLDDAIYNQLGEKMSLSDLLEHIARGNIVVCKTVRPDKAKINQAQAELRQLLGKLDNILETVATQA